MKPTSFRPVTIVIAFALSACAARTSPVDFYGQSAPASAAERTIVITPATRYVNVVGGQIIKFLAGDKEFAWNFNNASTVSSFNLTDVAPSGVLDHPVRAYISPDPKYIGGRAAHGGMR